MAVEFDGGVVIGADSRTSTGYYIIEQFRIQAQVYHLSCTP